MQWRPWLEAGGVGFFLYLVLITAGRLLRRRGGWDLGMGYQLFAVVFSAWLAAFRMPSSKEVLHHLGWATAFFSVFPLLALLRRVVWEWYFTQMRRVHVPLVYGQLLGVLLAIGFALLVLSFGYGVQVPGLLAGSGIAAVVLGFAMQDLLGNVIAGLAIHVEAPYRVGDWLLIEGEPKEVIEINWRATRLRSDENVWVDIPNSQMSKDKITNLTYPDRLHAQKLKIGADYKEPPNRVRAAILRAALQAKHVLADPAPEAHVVEFADSAVIYELEFWITKPECFDAIFDSVRTNLWYEFRREGINIPFPMRTLEILRRGPEAGLDEEARAVAASAPILKGLAESQRAQLCAAGRRLLYGRGERLVTEGEAGDSMFLLLRGVVSVVLNRSGGPETVARLREGDCFGEMSLLTGQPRSATVVADEDCEALVIGKAAVGDLLESEPKLAEQLSLLLAERRLANEAKVSREGDASTPASQQKLGDYARSFLRQVSTFFEL